ncbi:cellulose synthase [Methylovirgula sp. 4M-Z18]|nr:cellulose synthase [Methylovirgula sp. 4M-Z18]
MVCIIALGGASGSMVRPGDSFGKAVPARVEAQITGSSADQPAHVADELHVTQAGSPAAGESAAPSGTEPPAAAPSPLGPSTAQPAPQTSGKPVVDETALRYFARQGDTRRLATEISRLRSLYPDWVPPADPAKAPPAGDAKLDHMWLLYSQGEFAATRAEIAARQAAEPGWTPPQDLLQRLLVAESRERLLNASDTKQYETVISLAVATPSLLTCGDADVLWRLAESFAATDRTGRAADVYRYILTTCTDAHDRFSTMEKASSLLSRNDVEPLLALGHTGESGDEFRAIHERLARNAVAAGDSDPSKTASAADLELFENVAAANQSASDALTLGGYLLRHGDPVPAEHWYRVSFERKNAAEPAEGIALALLAQKKPTEAEAILAPWRDASENTRKSYAAAVANVLALEPRPVLAPDVLARMVRMVAAERDAAAAQQFGWYSHAFHQEDTAARWFMAALKWKPDDEPSAFGLAIVSQILQRRDTFAALEKEWGERSARIRALVVADAASKAASPAPTSLVTKSGHRPAPASAAPARERLAARPGDSCGSDLAGGWCLMNLHRDAQAAEVFRHVATAGSAKDRPEAAYGLSLADLRMGLTSQAASATTEAPQTAPRAKELNVAVLTQRANAEYEAGHYAQALSDLDKRAHLVPEQPDLRMLRGWSYYHLNRFDEAEQTFEALAAAGFPKADSAAATVRRALIRRE